jgi:hypothetical protein
MTRWRVRTDSSERTAANPMAPRRRQTEYGASTREGRRSLCSAFGGTDVAPHAAPMVTGVLNGISLARDTVVPVVVLFVRSGFHIERSGIAPEKREHFRSPSRARRAVMRS